MLQNSLGDTCKVRLNSSIVGPKCQFEVRAYVKVENVLLGGYNGHTIDPLTSNSNKRLVNMQERYCKLKGVIKHRSRSRSGHVRQDIYDICNGSDIYEMHNFTDTYSAIQ